MEPFAESTSGVVGHETREKSAARRKPTESYEAGVRRRLKELFRATADDGYRPVPMIGG